MASTAQAAKALGVSEARVRALIKSGALAASKQGRSWNIDDASLEQRAKGVRLRGRPKYGEPDAQLIAEYTLMNGSEAVLDFVYKKSNRTVAAIDTTVGDPSRAPVGACSRPGHPTRDMLTAWISERYIPENRIGIGELLQAAGCPSADELMFKTLGLNLTDSFWFKPRGAKLDWHSINFFENDYAGTKTGEGPNSGTPGQLAKWWEKRGGTNWLVKASTSSGKEPFAELAATRLYERLLEPGDFVPYVVEEHDGMPHSACPSFIAAGEELVTMRDLCRCYGMRIRDFEKYVGLLEQLGLGDAREAVSKMIVCDFLTANEDRHELNLGVVRDAATGAFLRVAPLFDNGRAFYYGARKATLGRVLYHHVSHPFSEYPTTQLACVEDYSWFDANRLDGFASELQAILAENEQAPSWFPEQAALQFELQLERVKEMAAERGWGD